MRNDRENLRRRAAGLKACRALLGQRFGYAEDIAHHLICLVSPLGRAGPDRWIRVRNGLGDLHPRKDWRHVGRSKSGRQQEQGGSQHSHDDLQSLIALASRSRRSHNRGKTRPYKLAPDEQDIPATSALNSSATSAGLGPEKNSGNLRPRERPWAAGDPAHPQNSSPAPTPGALARFIMRSVFEIE